MQRNTRNREGYAVSGENGGVMRYERERGICDRLRVELGTGTENHSRKHVNYVEERSRVQIS